MTAEKRETLLLPALGELDKLSGLRFAAAHGLPVPRIFGSFEEARRSGRPFLARGYFKGRADNDLIDVLPTKTVTTPGKWKRIQQEGRAVLSDSQFRAYARQMGIDPASLEVGFFLQEKAPDNLRTTTMDNGNMVLVGSKVFMANDKAKQYRTTFGAEMNSEGEACFGTTANFSKAALFLHQKTKAVMQNCGSAFAMQMEMVGEYKDFCSSEPDTSPPLSLVQIRTVAPLPHQGITFLRHHFDIGKVKAPQGKQHYLIIDDASSCGKINLGWDFSRLGMLIFDVFDEPEKQFTLLEHGFYRLMKLVWQGGGAVIVNSCLERQELVEIARRNLSLP